MAGVREMRDAVERAQDFVLDEGTWDEFTRLLDAPVRPDPRLVELFARPQRVSRGRVT